VLLFLLHHEVADAADGAKLHVGTGLRELLAQTVHIDLDRVRSGIDFAEQLCLDPMKTLRASVSSATSPHCSDNPSALPGRRSNASSRAASSSKATGFTM